MQISSNSLFPAWFTLLNTHPRIHKACTLFCFHNLVSSSFFVCFRKSYFSATDHWVRLMCDGWMSFLSFFLSLSIQQQMRRSIFQKCGQQLRWRRQWRRRRRRTAKERSVISFYGFQTFFSSSFFSRIFTPQTTPAQPAHLTCNLCWPK